MGLKIGFKMTYGNCFDFFSFPLDLLLFAVSDYEEVVAVEFSGGCDEITELALAGFLGSHVVAYSQLLTKIETGLLVVHLFTFFK